MMRGQLTRATGRDVLVWTIACVLMVTGALVTELAPAVFGAGDQAVVDWSFGYVTMKFVVLPGASLLLVVLVLVWLLRRSRVPLMGLTAGLRGVAYLIQLVLWPRDWFV